MKKNTAFLFLTVLSCLFLSCNNSTTPATLFPEPVKDIVCSGVLHNAITLAIGSEKQLYVKVVPEQAADKTVRYTTNNAAIASITEKGLIKGHKTGTAKITVWAANGISKTLFVTITPPHNKKEKNQSKSTQSASMKPESRSSENKQPENKQRPPAKTENHSTTDKSIAVEHIEITEPLVNTAISLTIGDSYTFTAQVLPETATDKRLVFSSTGGVSYSLQNEQTCTVRAENTGNATITVTSVSNPQIKKEIHFTVKEKPTIKLTEQVITCESTASQPAFRVQTLSGKLTYTPEVMGSGSRWVRFKTKDSTNIREDIITLECEVNKTVWERSAYIKFRDENGSYIKTTGSGGRGKDLEVKLTQKKNEHPNVRVEWVYGIGSPSNGEKVRIPIPPSETNFWRDDYIFFWNETVNTKWFNTRKIVNLNKDLLLGIPTSDGSDTNQCWAKTASNMLHWWFEQNKNYIDRYLKKKGLTEEQRKEYQPHYKRGLSDREEDKKSSIANIFRTKTHDGTQGDYANSALMWYLFGNHSLTQKNYEPALFKDVFTKENSPVEVKPIHTKKEFEETIKEALSSRKAIGINIYGTTGYRHYITIWGAAFDEDENIVAVYVVDNNYKENRIFPYGIHYNGKDIYADEDTDGTYPFLFNFPNNAVNKEKYIGEITTLGTGTEQFEAYLNGRL